MLRFVAVMVCTGALAGCGIAKDAIVDGLPPAGVSRVEYQKLSACVARRADEPSMRKLDLLPERTIKLTGAAMAWEITFVGRSDGKTEWSIINGYPGGRVSTIERLRGLVEACEAEVGQ